MVLLRKANITMIKVEWNIYYTFYGYGGDLYYAVFYFPFKIVIERIMVYMKHSAIWVQQCIFVLENDSRDCLLGFFHL